jgi:hypothetical protein
MARFLSYVLGGELGDAHEERINCRHHFGVAFPLAMQKSFQDVDGLEKQIHNLAAGLKCAIAQASD